MNYRGAVLFDLDGTLVDTAADFVHIIQQMMHSEKRPLLDERLIRNTVSEGARGLIRLAYQLQDEDPLFEEKRQWLLELYAKELGRNAMLFDGYQPLLQALASKQLGWGIVTNKPWRFTEPLLQQLQLQPSNNVTICPDHVSQTKPHAEPLLLAASQLQLAPASCIYVGDHRRDIEAARNAGMFSIACAFGYIHDEDDINSWQADKIVQSVAELHQFIDQHFKTKSHV